MNIKKIEITDPLVLEAIKQRYEFMHGSRGDELSDREFIETVKSLERLIAVKLCMVFGAVVAAGAK